MSDIVLGEPDLAGYLDHHPHYGAITGRYANRISDGQFDLNGHTYQLPKNKDNRTCLHGGSKGFDKKLWSADTMTDGDDSIVHLTYASPHDEEGFPGELETVVSYRLTSKNELRIDYAARSSRATVINLTNHSYFNLGGQESESVRDHEVCICAPYFLPSNQYDTPTGEILSVKKTDFDFLRPILLEERMNSTHPQFVKSGGFDHCYVFGKRSSDRDWDCRVTHPSSGRTMEVLTDQPAVQSYTGNSLGENTVAGKNGKPPVAHQALCLETQHFPDSPNIPFFPTTRLEPEDTFQSYTIYRFGLIEKTLFFSAR
jgi:aldose 1-epimerase